MKKSTQKKLLTLIGCMVFMAILTIPTPAAAEDQIDQGSIYGQITLKDGSKLQGPIRWGKEEALWHDFFNSTKEENDFSVYLSGRELRELRRKNGGSGFGGFLRRMFGGLSGDSDVLPTHQFVCRFGEIKEMQMRGGDTVILTFKDGERQEVEGGSNDIEAKLHIIDREQGDITLKWDKIRAIEFMAAPQPLKGIFGKPLFGTVTTKYGNFKGYIQWDHEECLDTDKLDGDSEDGDISVEFAKIKAIEKFKRGSLVTLLSGKEIYIYGSNDVNDNNRGIIINDLNFGKIRVDWDEFDRLDFEPNPAAPPAGYDEFITPKPLSGKVFTKDGRTYSGKIVYDLDEAMDFEIISGSRDDIEYNIPLRNIDTITPAGSCCSKITLKNGKTIELEDERDVNGDNDGLLVWGDSKEPDYISWQRIKEIKLN